MIHAIHSDNTEDHASQLQKAYHDLSRGLNLPTEEASSSKPWISKDRSRDYPPAVGAVPGIVSVAPRQSRSQERRSKKSTPRSSVAPPWGPERANLDRPPWEQVLQKQ